MRTLVECILEGVAGGEADGGRRLVDERCVGTASGSEPRRDAAAWEYGVRDGRRPGGAWFGPLVPSCPGFVAESWGCSDDVAAAGEPHYQCRGTGAIVVECEPRPAVPEAGGAERPTFWQS